MEDLGLRALTVVNTVAVHGSFRRAARELDMSPSSVSHMVAGVESRLGIRLFLRNTRSVSLTEAGAVFLERLAPALRDITAAVDDVHALRDQPAGLVRINASTWGADRILPLVLAFMERYPDVKIDLVTEGRIVDIVAEGFDCGLRVVPMIPQDMVAVPLGVPEAMVVVAAPAYLARRGVPHTPADLLAHTCVHARLPSGALMRWDFDVGPEPATVDVRGSLTVGTTALAAKAAAGGAGIAYVEAREAEDLLATGQLARVLEAWTPPFEGHALYYPRQRLPSAALRAFLDFCRANVPLTR